jgi:predicted acyltransferase
MSNQVSADQPTTVRVTGTLKSEDNVSASLSLQLSQPSSLSTKAPRLVSLDVFRGITIAAMILVNDPGTWSAAYAPLLHAEWNGWTPTDLVFPFFLLIIGVAMEFSFASRREQSAGARQHASIIRHVFYRAAIIFALGLFLHLFPFYPWHRVRIMGVLQRIAVCYFFAALLTLKTGFKTRIATVAALLFGYWALMMLVPVPGYGAGHLDEQGNLAAYLDRTLLAGHTWKPQYDPEGLLSSLPAIATTLLGGFAGKWLRSPASKQRKLLGLVFVGVLGLLCGELWNIWFPINKSLWTSSYVIFTAGFACLLLALCYWLIEIKNWRKWATPLLVFGKNAIAAFVFSILLAKILIIWKLNEDGKRISLQGYLFQHWFAPLASPQMASLLFALCFVFVCWLAMYLLYRKQIFLKI